MSLDVTSPSNRDENALDYASAKKTAKTIDHGKENKALNDLMSLSLDTIQQQSAHSKLSNKLKPVDQTYNCRNNKSKFCLPVSINSARTLENELEKVRKEYVELT